MNINNLIFAIREVIDTEKEEREARENYDGYEWGYHGHYYTQKADNAKEEFEKIILDVIDERVRLILKEQLAKEEIGFEP